MKQQQIKQAGNRRQASLSEADARSLASPALRCLWKGIQEAAVPPPPTLLAGPFVTVITEV